MGKCKKRHFYPMFILGAVFITGILYLLIRLAVSFLTGMTGEYQAVVSLGNMTYDQRLLKQVEKIQGLVSFSPVLEIPVELKLDDYTMSTVLLAVDLKEFKMEGKTYRDMEIGNIPMLLAGKNTLKHLKDPYGHTISKRRLAAFWEKSNKGLQYHIAEDGLENTESSSHENTEKSGSIETDWAECQAAACLSNPSEGIYISLEQGRDLLEGTGLDCRKSLLTVRGKEAFEKARAVFADFSE